MMWQDAVLMVGGFLLFASLIPAIKSRARFPWSTCALQAIILTAFVAAYITLGLWLGTIAMILNAGAWWFLLFKR